VIFLLKTLNGRVEESVEDLVSFIITTEEGIKCFFKASTINTKKAWVSDIHAILQSQVQMKKGETQMHCVLKLKICVRQDMLRRSSCKTCLLLLF